MRSSQRRRIRGRKGQEPSARCPPHPTRVRRKPTRGHILRLPHGERKKPFLLRRPFSPAGQRPPPARISRVSPRLGRPRTPAWRVRRIQAAEQPAKEPQRHSAAEPQPKGRATRFLRKSSQNATKLGDGNAKGAENHHLRRPVLGSRNGDFCQTACRCSGSAPFALQWPNWFASGEEICGQT